MPTDVVVTRFITEGVAGLRSDLGSIESSMGAVEARAERVGRVSDKLLGFGAAGAGALALLGKSSLEAAGNLQRTEAGLKSLLGSSDAAKSKMAEISTFAAASPFSFEESAKGAQQLLALGFAADKVKPTLDAVGNAVASVGGSSDTLGGVITALGQIESKGKLSQEEALQIAERGIPIFKILEKQLGLTKDQIGALGNQGIESGRAIEAILKGMKEMGGGNAMADQMKTLPGQLSTLEDSAQQLKATLGGLFTEDATKFVATLNSAAGSLNDFVKNNPALSKGIAGLLGVGALGVVGAGVAGKAAGVYNEIAEGSERARRKKLGLSEATDKDAASEKRKTAIAITEAGSIRSTADASDEAARSKGALSAATERLSKMEAARITISTKLAQAQQQLAKAAPGSPQAKAAQAQVDSLKAAIGRVNAQAKEARAEVEDATQAAAGGASSGWGAAALAALSGDSEAAKDAIKGHFEELAQSKLDAFLDAPLQTLKDFKAQGLASVASVRAALSRPLILPPGGLGAQLGLRAGHVVMPSVLGSGGGALTGGMAAAAGANGLLAGYEAQQGWERLGYSQGQAMSIGLATGLGTAAVTALNPAAGALILAAGAIREGAERLVLSPADQEALRGNGLSDEEAAKQGSMTNAQKAQQYRNLAEQKRREAAGIDTRFDFAGDDRARKEDLLRDALRFQGEAKRFQKQADAENSPAAMAERQKRALYAEWDAKHAEERRGADMSAGQVNVGTPKQVGQVINHRDGSQTVTFVAQIQESPYSTSQREARYQRVALPRDREW